MSYLSCVEKHSKWASKVFEKIDKKLSRTAIKNRNVLPYSNDAEGNCICRDVTWWTNGFWGGLMWLMYNHTKNPEYALTAKTSEQLLRGAFKKIDGLHHDVGFMYHLVSGASYRLTGDADSRATNLIAAMMLASRYNVRGEFIRAWNIPDSEGWTIIDSMMNIPLLFWASRELSDDRFAQIAIKQADMCARDHVREDGTINHIVMHDLTMPGGKMIGTRGGQGYCEGSCWSRGQSWAVYGFILAYIHTQDEKYLKTAIKVADVFIDEAKKTDWLVRSDFRQPEESFMRDSTAGAIASCGLIEIAKNLPQEKADKYISAAISILTAMEENWCDWSDDNDAILQMGSEQYRAGRHLNIIYGDFYFTEAILKLLGSDFLIW